MTKRTAGMLYGSCENPFSHADPRESPPTRPRLGGSFALPFNRRASLKPANPNHAHVRNVCPGLRRRPEARAMVPLLV